jgi:hypothetical protein
MRDEFCLSRENVRKKWTSSFFRVNQSEFKKRYLSKNHHIHIHYTAKKRARHFLTHQHKLERIQFGNSKRLNFFLLFHNARIFDNDHPNYQQESIFR